MNVLLKRVLALLLAISAIGGIYRCVTKPPVQESVKLADELTVELPPPYSWLQTLHYRYHYRVPTSLISRVDQASRELSYHRDAPARKLFHMGTNVWPAVPKLVDALDNPDGEIAFTSGLILAQSHAQDSPEWPRLEKRLRGRRNATRVFEYLLRSHNEFLRPFGEAEHLFGLIGLTAVGPAGKQSIPAILNALHSKEEYGLWRPAMVALRETGGDVTAPVPFLKQVLCNVDEWPVDIRIAAAEALIVANPQDPEMRTILRECLNDERGVMRLAAAKELWKLNGRPEEILPTLTGLLAHKLVTVRTGALSVIADIGTAAQSIQPQVKHMVSDTNTAISQAASAALKNITIASPQN